MVTSVGVLIEREMKRITQGLDARLRWRQDSRRMASYRQGIGSTQAALLDRTLPAGTELLAPGLGRPFSCIVAGQ